MSTPSPKPGEEQNPAPPQESLELVLDIPVEVTIELGRTEMALREVMQFAPGSIVELAKKADEPVSLYVNRKLVAQGEVVLVDNNLGIKISYVTGTAQALPGETTAKAAKVEE
jgi:flagellar motor switch protein FliN